MIVDILPKTAGCILIVCMIFTSMSSETLRRAFNNNNNNNNNNNDDNNNNHGRRSRKVHFSAFLRNESKSS